MRGVTDSGAVLGSPVAPSQPDRHHLSCRVAKMILVTYKSDVHPLVRHALTDGFRIVLDWARPAMAATMPLTPDGPRQAQGSAAGRGMEWPWACSAASTVGTSRNGVFPAPVLRSPPVTTVGEGGRRQAQRPGRGSGRRWPAAGKRLRGGLHGIEAVVEQTERNELRSWRIRLHLAKPRFTALQRVMERTGVPGAGSCPWRSFGALPGVASMPSSGRQATMGPSPLPLSRLPS